MKSIFAKAAALALACTTLLSFTINRGGEGFEIYLNNKVVLQKFGKEMDKVSSLQLNAASSEDKMVIRYHHCGRVGKNRVITIKDGNDKSLKEFHFNDASNAVSAMEIKVKELVNIKSGNTVTLRLYYSSSELPAGRMLVTLNTANRATTKL